MTIIEEKLRSGPVEFDVYECDCGSQTLMPKNQIVAFATCSRCGNSAVIADTITLKLND